MILSKRIVFYWIFIFFCCSCQDRKVKVYEVPNEIQPYVSSFLAEAAKRGYRLVIDDLIVTYKFNIITSQVHAAGLCRKRHGHTPIIYIDTTSTNWRASELSKEQLVFHELCHCILGRGHTSDTLLNGNYASIMKPSGETLYGSSLSYFKRSYYIDELFDAQAEKPAWAQVTESYSKSYTVKDTIYFEDFEYIRDSLDVIDSNVVDTLLTIDSLKYKDWVLGQNNVIRRWVLDGRLELENFQKGTFYIPFNVDIPTDENFEIRVKMVIPGGKNGQMAFYWGGSSIADAYAFISNHSGFVSIGSIRSGVVAAKNKVEIYNDDYNELLIRKVDGFYYFFFNQRFIDNLMFEPFFGNLFGFGVSGNASEIWIDDILMTTID